MVGAMIPSKLTAREFREWRVDLGMSQPAAAKRLGISLSSIYSYENGHRREGNVKIPLLVTLGMIAICNNLQPYEGDNNVNSN